MCGFKTTSLGSGRNGDGGGWDGSGGEGGSGSEILKPKTQ